VSAKSAAHFRSTLGGFFPGMVAKAKADDLDLQRTIGGLCEAATPKPRREPGRAWVNQHREARGDSWPCANPG
jgi:hypothetical protein